MPQFLFSNKAVVYLASDFGSSSTSIVLATGDGELFPSPTVGQVAPLTLEDRRVGKVERMRMTARSGDTLTVTRAEDGTTAQSWVTGDQLSLRATAEVYTAFSDDIAANATAIEDINDPSNGAVRKTGDVMSGDLRMSGTASVQLDGGPVDVTNQIDAHLIMRRGASTNTKTMYVSDLGVLNIDGSGGPAHRFPPSTDDTLTTPETLVDQRLGDLTYLRLDGAVNMTDEFSIETTGPRISFIDTDVTTGVFQKFQFRQLDNVFQLRALSSDDVTVSAPYSITLDDTLGIDRHSFRTRLGTTVARIDYDDADRVLLPERRSVVTRERGDARYVEAAAQVWAKVEPTDSATPAGSWTVARGNGLDISRVSAGVYTITLSTTTSQNNYGIQLTPHVTDAYGLAVVQGGTQTTGGFEMRTYSNTGVLKDLEHVFIQIVGHTST